MKRGTMFRVSAGTIVEKAVGNRETSVIRRSLWVTGFFVLGYFFYYCLILVSNRRLSSGDFGRFYTAWTILNIIATPGGIVALLLAGYYGRAFRQGNRPLLVAALFGAARQLAIPTLILIGLLEIGFKISGAAIGVDSPLLGILLPLVAVASFMVEVVRATFQGSMQFTRYGIYWALWCGLQLALGSLALLWFKAPWAVFVGMLAASLLVFGWLVRTMLQRLPDAIIPLRVDPLTFEQFLPFCSALLGAILFINIDILVSFVSFRPAVHGGYAASAFLAKAIVTGTQPVLQTMIPLIVFVENVPFGRRLVTLKAIGVGAALALCGSMFLWLGAGQLCGGRHGIQYCDISIMKLLAISAIPLTILRVWVVADVTYKRYGMAQWMYPAVAVFLFVAWKHAFDPSSLAVMYCVCCWGALAFRASFQLLSIVGARRQPS
jgi:O-antigen/teichoic acid export membrane protein